MATTIKIKNSGVTTTTPTTLAEGELAVNYTDRKVWVGNASGTPVALTQGLPGTVSSVSGTGTVNGITLTGTVTSTGNLTLGGTLANVNLASQVTGTLPATNGGTGQSTLTTGDVLYASATNTLSKLAVGTTNQVLTVSGGVPTWATPSSGTDGFNQMQVFTSSGTFTSPSSGTFKVTIVGGGGGGGRSTSTGGGGGGGGTCVKYYTGVPNATSCTVTIGTGGAGATSANGTAGGNSSFSGSGLTTLTANGGSGATGQTGGTGGTATNGTLNVQGGTGAPSNRPPSGSLGGGGIGGGSLLGFGGAGVNGTPSAGGNGTGYGAGGQGGGFDSSAADGGAGTDGICIVEY